MLLKIRIRRLSGGCVLLFFAISILKILEDFSKSGINSNVSATNSNRFESFQTTTAHVPVDLCLKNTHNKESQNKIKGQVNKAVNIFPKKLAMVLTPRILQSVTKLYNLCSTTLNNTEINSKSFLKLLKKLTSSSLANLSKEVTENYTSGLDIKALSRNLLSNQVVNLTIVNKYSYSYIHSPINICRGKNVYLLVVVKSGVEHYHTRQVLRKTWIRNLMEHKKNTVVVFSLGHSHRERYMIDDEDLIHRDIIQGSFTDAYRNNTLKMIMALEWTTQYCRNARFVFFVDDDLIVNVKSTIKFLSTVPKEMEENLYSGIPIWVALPERSNKSKWCIDEKSYPYPIYPEYITGGTIFMSANVVRKLQSVFPYVRYLPFDDVYIGIVAKTLGIPIHDNTLLTKVNKRNITSLKTYIASNHGIHDEELLFETYKKMIK
ncbi:hypothetical protein FSP39_011131 [Pinctada imbricata]|uniref:Hexosyltransferase n=1 Tax=Pinctada imbricata TaxID=66713 RepID=A0AA88YBT6_PINIB|nr:hypothetical protein FSP39_011131 [Pinctada imbricata]